MEIENLNQKASRTSGVRPNFLYGNLLDQMRYIETLKYIKELDVLDIASGVGWGSYLMSTVAKSVMGVDLSEEAIKTSKKYYSNSNVSFELGNSKKIPSNDNSFDAIVSFETIEHIEIPQNFIDEVSRVAKPGAILILSTPNGYCTKMKKDARPSNPFHVEEYYKSELFRILEKDWEIIDYKGQYPIKNDSAQVDEYRQWIKDYWYLNKIRENNSSFSKIYSRLIVRLRKFISYEPAYNYSCNPVTIENGYEPVVHFVICRSKK